MGGRFLLSKLKLRLPTPVLFPKLGFLSLEILQDTNEINT